MSNCLRRFVIEYQLTHEGMWFFFGIVNAKSEAGALGQFVKERKTNVPAYVAVRAAYATAEILQKITGQGSNILLQSTSSSTTKELLNDMRN